ncbi:MAG: radical SAM family heme chaperone HemW [Clostridiales bacterium]|nr:radical SAM family heme chaperone HemW [Clostridiales bacterium]
MHIYVHIPFCARKCPYCGFFSVAGKTYVKEYFDALEKEVFEQPVISSAEREGEMETVYFGGGTPSFVDASYVCNALKSIRHWFSIEDGEFTVEVNPNSLDEAKARAYKEAGFNRISIGVQSLHDDVLLTLGRLHDRNEALHAIRIAKDAGFDNISCDLILGVPGQREEDLYEDASCLIEAGAKHISMYSLSIEEGTPFENKYGDKLYEFVDEELERKMYHGLRDFLKTKGFGTYEISNCALPGYESRHNLSYWSGSEYYAFGAGSHGYLNSVRFAHPESIEEYVKDPMKRITEEVLSEEDKNKERCMLALRTSRGMNFELCKDYPDEIKKNLNLGYLEKTDTGYRLTSKGLDYANQVFMDFV